MDKPPPLSRRNLLAAGAAGTLLTAASSASAASFGNPDEPPQGIINSRSNPHSAADPGPQNPAIVDQFPQAFSPPPTDVGDLPQLWASFNNAPRRIQDGGWARQVTQADFQVAQEISGVNMRLDPGGIRELHWHQAAEWAFMSYGNCRITVLDLRVGLPLPTLRKATFGIFQRAIRTRSRVSSLTGPSSYSPSTMASSLNSTPCRLRPGWLTRHPTF